MYMCCAVVHSGKFEYFYFSFDNSYYRKCPISCSLGVGEQQVDETFAGVKQPGCEFIM